MSCSSTSSEFGGAPDSSALSIEQLILRKNVGDPTVFCTSAASKEEMLEPVHQTVQWLDFDVQGVLRRFLRNVVAIEDLVNRVKLHDCKHRP